MKELSLHEALKKQLANDNRNRGPPPPTPNRNVSIIKIPFFCILQKLIFEQEAQEIIVIMLENRNSYL